MLQKSEKRQVTRFTILIFPHRLLCSNKWWARPFIQWWYSVIDFLIVTASILKLLHSWLFIDPSEHHYTTQTSKFNNFLNRSSTMLNNVFNFILLIIGEEYVQCWELCEFSIPVWSTERNCYRKWPRTSEFNPLIINKWILTIKYLLKTTLSVKRNLSLLQSVTH